MEQGHTPQLSYSPQEVQIPQNLVNPQKPWLKIILFLILGVFLFTGLVFAGYLLAGNKQTQPTPTSSPLALPTSTPDPTANWKTYTDEKGQFSFKYPQNLLIKDELIEGNANEYTKTFSTFFRLEDPNDIRDGRSNVLVRIKVQSRQNASLLEKEDFDYIQGHIVYKIIDRQTSKLNGKNATKITLTVGEGEPEKSQYIYTDFNSGSLKIELYGQHQELFDLMLSTFKFLPLEPSQGEKVFCQTPRPEACTMECIANPPYICGSDGKSYCSTCQACSDSKVKWYVTQETPCSAQ